MTKITKLIKIILASILFIKIFIITLYKEGTTYSHHTIMKKVFRTLQSQGNTMAVKKINRLETKLKVLKESKKGLNVSINKLCDKLTKDMKNEKAMILSS